MKSSDKIKIYDKIYNIVKKRIDRNLSKNKIEFNNFIEIINKKYLSSRKFKYDINVENIKTTNTRPSIEKTIIKILDDKSICKKMEKAEIDVDELRMQIENNNIEDYMNSFNDLYKIMVLYYFIDKYNDENIERKKCYSSFVPIEIQHYSEKYHNFVYKVNIDKLDINITLLSSRNINNISWFKKLIYRTITLKLLFNFNEKINIRILDTQINKKFNNVKDKINCKNCKIIGPKEINSGFTTTGKNEIVIFRNEEILKVLIHEIIHLFKLDDKINFNKNLTDSIIDLLHIQNGDWVRPSEGIVELLANIYNIAFNVLEKGGTFYEYLYIEATHSIIQSSRILKYMNMEYNNNLIIVPNADKYQRTSAISYYVIRASLYWYLGDVIKQLNLLNSYTKNYKINLNKYKKIISKSLQNKNLMGKNGVIQMIPFHIINNTLKMTIT